MNSIFSGYKILNHQEWLSKVSKDNRVFPIMAEIDLTNACNHDCLWCLFKKYKNKSPVTLDKDFVFGVLKELKSVGIKSIVYSGGGEPLLHPDFEEIMNKTKELGFEIGVITNGELLGRYKKVIEDTCTFVRVSLDAGSSQTHRKLHSASQGAYQTILEALELIDKDKVTVGVGYLLWPENYFLLPKLFPKLVSYQVEYIYLRPVYLQHLKFSTALKQKIHDMVEECKRNFGSKIYIKYSEDRYDEVVKGSQGCLAHSAIAVLGADKKLYLCSFLKGRPKFVIGDLKRETFSEVWKGETRQKIINSIDQSRCPNCRYKKYDEVLKYLASDRRHSNFL